MTDENADAWDPAVLRFDHAKDSLNFTAKALYADRLNLRYAITKLPKPGDSYQKRTSVIMGSISQVFANCTTALPYIGGMNANRNHRGDAQEKPTLTPVSPKLQRQALDMILNNCFNPSSFNLPQSVLNSLSVDLDAETGTTWTAPLRKFLSLRMAMLFSQLVQADRLSRIARERAQTSRFQGRFRLNRLSLKAG